MKTRVLLATALLLFAFAPAAFAQCAGTCSDTPCSTLSPAQVQDTSGGTCPQAYQVCCVAVPAATSGTGAAQGGSGSGGVTPNPGNNGNNGGVTPNPGNNGNVGVTLLNPLAGNCSSGSNCLASFLSSILALVVRIGSIIVILMLVFVGFKFVQAQGNSEKIAEARSMLLWTIIGGLILLGAQALSAGILATVNALSSGN